MGAIESLRAMVRPLARRVALLAGRGVLRLSDSSPKLQTLQAEFLRGETRGPLEHFQEFGWTSRPPIGSELVALFFNGSRDHGVVVAVEHRETRPQSLEEGEACAYNAFGTRIYLRKDGSIEITASGNLIVNAPGVHFSGDLLVDGSIEAGAQVSDAQGSLAQAREQYNIHTHAGVETGSGTTAPPLPPMQ